MAVRMFPAYSQTAEIVRFLYKTASFFTPAVIAFFVGFLRFQRENAAGLKGVFRRRHWPRFDTTFEPEDSCFSNFLSQPYLCFAGIICPKIGTIVALIKV